MNPLPHNASFNLITYLVIIFTFSISLCSSFLINERDLSFLALQKKEIKELTQINIYTSISGDQVVGNEIKLTAYLDKPFNQSLQVELICQGEKCHQILKGTRFGVQTLNETTKKLEWKLELHDNGLATLFVEPINREEIRYDIEINNAHSLQQLKVGKSYALNTWSMIIGYIYFVAWMLSLYPILITNFRRQSVSGLNLDFVALNTTGYLAYSVYNIALYSIDSFQEAYFEKFPGSQIPVQFNDILFATHGSVINILIGVQCIFYERGNQKITDTAKGLLVAIYSPALILTFFYIANGVDKYYYITFFSYTKLLLTLCKYVPQAYYNYKRKSTEGWSVVYCFLDFTGGSLSICQMLLNSINQDDYRNFTGNAGKVGLGLVSISFDVLFIIQHYVLYRHRDEPILETPSEITNTYGNNNPKQFDLRQNIKKGLSIDNLNNNILISGTAGFRNQGYDEN